MWWYSCHRKVQTHGANYDVTFSDPLAPFSDLLTPDPLYVSGSTFRCASDGDSEGSPLSISTSMFELLVIRWT
eukprot:7182498-Heterocapsa_arctica.AAC.1